MVLPLAVNVPEFVHVPEILIFAAGPVIVELAAIVRFMNWVPSMLDPPKVVFPENVMVWPAPVANDPPFAVKFDPFISILKVLALKIPLVILRTPLIIIALSRVTLPPPIVKLLRSSAATAGNSGPVVTALAYDTL